MSTETKSSVFRYGIDLPNNRLIFKPGTTAERPIDAGNGLTRLNEDLRTIEFFLNGTWMALASQARSVESTKTGSFSAAAGLIYPVNGSLVTIQLPSNAVTGDTVIIIDEAGNFSDSNVVLSANKIRGRSENYPLERDNDVITATFINESYGWKIDHAIAALTTVSERFSGSVNITETTPITLPVNKLITVDVSKVQTVHLTLPTGIHGDEIYLQCINDTGMGAIPGAMISSKLGESINGTENASISLNGKEAWIKLKHLSGWRVTGKSGVGGLIPSLSLNDPLFRSPGKYYVSNVLGGTPKSVPQNLHMLIEVEEGRGFSGVSTVTEAFQNLFAPSLGRKWERYFGNTWRQCTPLNEVTTSNQEYTCVPNTRVRSTNSGLADISIQETPMHGDKIILVTGSGPQSEIAFNILRLNGVEVNGYRITSPSRSVEFTYDHDLTSWIITADSNPLLISAGKIQGGMLTYDQLSVRGTKHYVNASGLLPYTVVAGDNELMVETKTRADLSLTANNDSLLGLVTLTDLRTGDVWFRPFDESSFTANWRCGNRNIHVLVSDSKVTSDTYAVLSLSQDMIFVNACTGDVEYDFSDYVAKGRPGDKLLIRNTTDTVITLTGVTVKDENLTEETSPSTMTGKGDVSFYLDDDNNLIVVSSVNR